MKSTAVNGWVLYDDSCGFCSRWVPFWSGTLDRRGLGIAPLQADWVRSRLSLSDAEILEDLLLLCRDGQLVRGADVYRYVMRRVWWVYPLYLFAIAPVGRRLFDWGYRTFARNRYRVSRACGLPGNHDGAANSTQAVRSETNSTSSAAGSDR